LWWVRNRDDEERGAKKKGAAAGEVYYNGMAGAEEVGIWGMVLLVRLLQGTEIDNPGWGVLGFCRLTVSGGLLGGIQVVGWWGGQRRVPT
jgi:hypothetical protein